MNNGLSWHWIALQATAPVPVAFLVAWAFWRGSNPMIGNIIGTGVVFIATVSAIGREYLALQALRRRCIEQQIPCPIHPDAFTRFAVYGFIGMFQIAALYAVSLWVEERTRRRNFSPEWR